MMVCPKVSIAILSWNRLNYLRATIESARQCIKYPNLEWIVIDNVSEEAGLREYLDGSAWIDHLIIRRCTHAEAMNEAVKVASGDYLILWPEDVQFVVAGDWMLDMVEIMEKYRWIGCMVLDLQRRSTMLKQLKPSWWIERNTLLQEIRTFGFFAFRHQRMLHSSRGARFFTYGWTADGIVGSGIPSLARTDMWRELGPWKTSSGNWAIKDSSLGAEEEMLKRWRRSGMPLQRVIPEIPVAADIITDPTGCKAKVRGPYRFGVYMPPLSNNLYYKIMNYNDLSGERDLPIDFSQGVEPLGFKIPVDSVGERLKFTINLSIATETKTGLTIPYVLAQEDINENNR